MKEEFGIMKYKKTLIEIFIAIILIALSLFFITKKEIYMDLRGNDSIFLNIDEAYKEEGIDVLYCGKYIKFKCINIFEHVTITNNIDNKTKGNYTVTYNIDYKGIKKELTRKVEVIDKEPPVIKLIKKENSYTCPNKEYIEEGYEVIDNVDKDLYEKVIITKQENGITYSVKDSSGNEGIAFRKYEYNDPVSPTIALNGYEYTYVEVGKDYKEPGYTANDNCDGTLTNKVKIEGSVNTNKEGTYPITYKVSDSSGNVTIVTRNVRVYTKKEYNEVKPDGKVIYLTFDDGPSYYTPKLLSILDEYNVKVTFFVTNQFSGYKSYIKEAHDKGHSIALHTSSHNFSKIYKSVDAYFADINAIDNTVYNQTNIHSKLVRFAGGSSNTVSCGSKGVIPAIVKEMNARGYKYFDWNVDSYDTSTNNSKTIANNIIKGVKNNKYSIVLQHDTKSGSVEAVRQVIEFGLANGYTFLPLTLDSPTVHHSISKCHY